MARPSPPHNRRRRLIAVLLVVALVVGLIQFSGPLSAAWMEKLRALRAEGGPWVYLGAGLFTYAAALIPFPAEVPALLNGVLFPPIQAFLMNWVLASLGAFTCYELGRAWGGGPAKRWFGAVRMEKLTATVAKITWPLLLALRLSPVMVFTAMSWAAGIARVRRPVYYWTTAAGIAPGAFLYGCAPEILTGEASARLYLGLSLALVALLAGLGVMQIRKNRGRNAAIS